MLNIYGGGDLVDYLVNFVNHLDPNGGGGDSWPRYTLDSPSLLTFQDGIVPLAITQDNFRNEGIALLTELSLEFPI